LQGLTRNKQQSVFCPAACGGNPRQSRKSEGLALSKNLLLQKNLGEKQKMKKIFLLSALLLVLMSFAFISCNNSQEKRSNYTINASYNAQTKTISADMSVEYYNDSETELSNVMFHLYPRAYREGAKYSPIENSSEQRQAAYPNGIDY
jgi:hypothetical protein